MMDLTDMHKEWEAWKTACGEFRDLTGIDINDSKCDRMVRAFEMWGALRTLAFDHKHRDTKKRAAQEAWEKYVLACGKRPTERKP